MSVMRLHLSRRLMSTVTLMLLLAALLTLVHWHQDSAGQRCEICFARQLPSIYVPFIVALSAPTRVEWHNPTEEAASKGADYIGLRLSRGPPRSSSL